MKGGDVTAFANSLKKYNISLEDFRASFAVGTGSPFQSKEKEAMNLEKAIQLYKNNVKFGDIRQQAGLSFSQMYLLDIGMRKGKTQAELESKMALVNDEMKGKEIEEVLMK